MIYTIIVFLSALILLYSTFRHTFFLIICILVYIPLIYYQYLSTVPTNYLKLTEIEKIEQLERMNSYPPTAYRLANIIEARPESVVYFKLESNFIGIFDLLLFNNIVTILLLPFFLIGYFNLLSSDFLSALLISFIPIIFLTLIGHNNTSGPLILYPILLSSLISGFYKLLSKYFIKNEN